MDRRIKTCDICNAETEENYLGAGFPPGWGTVTGVNNDDNPTGTVDLCPEHLLKVVSLLEDMLQDLR